MSFLFSKRAVADSHETIVSGTGIFSSVSGGTVSENKVLGIAAAWAATRVISESVSMLPFLTFRRVSNGKERAPEHPTYKLLSLQPNPELTSIEFWDAMTGQAVLRGNSYASVERNGAGRVVALWPLRSDRMRVERINGELSYIYNLNESRRMLNPADVLHIKGFGLDGFAGLDPLKVHSGSYGASIAADEQSTRFYKNDASPGGILQHPGRLSNEARENMANSWNEAHKGFENRHRIAILEEGVTWQAVGLDPERSQMLQTREFNVTEIARIFRVPPHMIADLSRATFSNVEQMSQDFLTHSLMPWLVRIEQAVNTTLFTQNEQRELFAEHQVQGLLRADAATRANFYNTGINGGWLSPDEVRSLENINPQPNGIGDVYQRPLNALFVGPGNTPDTEPEPEPETEQRSSRREQRDAQNRLAMQLANVPVFENVLREIITRERADILKIAKRNIEQRGIVDFKRELTKFYEGHRGFIRRKYRPLVRSLAEASHISAANELDTDPEFNENLERFVDEYTETYELRHIKSGQRQIEAIADESNPDEVIENIETRLDEWGETRHQKLARREVVQIGNAAVHATFLIAGLLAWRWVTTGAEDCPICTSLDGRTVGTSGQFFGKGEMVKADGAEPIKTRTNVKHPPLHQGCDCQIVPG